MIRTVLAVLLAALLTVAVAAPAQASPAQTTILQDDVLLLRQGPEVRDRTLDEIRGLGVDQVKLTVRWRSLAPAGRRRPAGFDGSRPESYPTDAWAPYDDAVRGAQAKGLDVFLMVAGPAPDWASRGGTLEGVREPDAEEFGRFVRAVGTRYSGSYAGLPRVTTWSIWNEPNLPKFLLPQRDRSRRPVSPRIYRGLYLAGHAALAGSGHARDSILMGELLPVGGTPRSTSSSVAPLEFLRELACVDRRLRPLRGRDARRAGCRGFRPLPGTGIAHHPYTRAIGPSFRGLGRDDVPIGSLSRLTQTADRLARRGRFAARRMPVHLTEFGIQSDPPDRIEGARLRLVPAFLNESEYIAWRNPRVASYSQYPLLDDPVGGVFRSEGFQSGLRLANGRTKRGVYDAFRLPFFVRLGRGTVEVWGGVRPAGPAATVQVESRLGRGRFAPLRGPIALGRQGYFRRTLRVSSASRREFRFRFGTETSRTARAARR